MRALLVFIVATLAGCTSAGQPGPASAGKAGGTTPPDTAAPVPAADAAAPAPGASESPAADVVDLTRGMRVDTHGIYIMLRGTGTEHRSKTATVSRAELMVGNGTEERTISLEREQPGDAKFVEVLGLQIALESVDASTKPSTAKILVRQ